MDGAEARWLSSDRVQERRKVQLRSRNDKDFVTRYPAVIRALANLPNQTVIDGEVVAFDENGRPSFNTLQNFGTSPGPVVYYVFDVMILARTDVTNRSLDERRQLLEQKVLPTLTEPFGYAAPLERLCQCHRIREVARLGRSRRQATG